MSYKGVGRGILTMLVTIAILVVMKNVSEFRMPSTTLDYIATQSPQKKKTSDCREVQFSKTELPLTYLASVQGSGNTWVRHLLQQTTGEYIDQDQTDYTSTDNLPLHRKSTTIKSVLLAG